MGDASVNIVISPRVDMFSFFLDKYLGVELWDPIANVCLTFKENVNVFPRTAVLFYSPTCE